MADKDVTRARASHEQLPPQLAWALRCGNVNPFVASLYAMSVPSGHLKVGMAYDPEARRKQLQTSNHEPISLEWTLEVGPYINVRQLEEDVHRRLNPWRARGEWFRITPQAAYEAARASLASMPVCRRRVSPGLRRLYCAENIGKPSRAVMA